MLTYLKAALWLADRSPELSHIPLLSVLSLVCLVVPFASWLWVTVPSACPCALVLAGWVALGLAVPVGGCGAGVEVGVAASALLPFVCLEPCSLSAAGVCRCPAWLVCLCALWPGLCVPAVSLALRSGRATSHCLPGVGVAAWPAGVGGSGCALVAEGGVS